MRFGFSPFGRSSMVVSGLGFLLGCACSLIPITGAVDYPLALVATPFLTLVAGLWSVAAARRGDGLLPSLRRGVGVVGLVTAAVVLPVLVTSLAWSRACEPGYGLLFVLMGPLASGLLSLGIGQAVGRLVKRRWLAFGAIPTLLLGSIVLAFGEFLFSPGVRVYGSFFGLYHGAVYDVSVFIDGRYLWLRFWNVLLFAGITLFLLYRERGGASIAA